MRHIPGEHQNKWTLQYANLAQFEYIGNESLACLFENIGLVSKTSEIKNNVTDARGKYIVHG